MYTDYEIVTKARPQHLIRLVPTNADPTCALVVDQHPRLQIQLLLRPPPIQRLRGFPGRIGEGEYEGEYSGFAGEGMYPFSSVT